MNDIGWQVFLFLSLIFFIGLPIFCIVCSKSDCCTEDKNKINYEIV